MKEDIYLEERRKSTERHNSESESYDKLLITLATGAFGLSFTFIKLIIPNPASHTINALAWAWGLLIISIIGSLFGRLLSQNAHRRAWENLDKKYKAHVDKETEPKLDNPWNIWVRGANWTSAICFVFGVIMLTFFAISNIKIEAEMAEKPKKSISGKKVSKGTSTVSSSNVKKKSASGSRNSSFIVDKLPPRAASEAPSAPITTSESKPPSKAKQKAKD